MQEHIVSLVQQALKEAGVSPADISCIAYTKVGHASRCHVLRLMIFHLWV